MYKVKTMHKTPASFQMNTKQNTRKNVCREFHMEDYFYVNFATVFLQLAQMAGDAPENAEFKARAKEIAAQIMSGYKDETKPLYVTLGRYVCAISVITKRDHKLCLYYKDDDFMAQYLDDCVSRIIHVINTRCPAEQIDFTKMLA